MADGSTSDTSWVVASWTCHLAVSSEWSLFEEKSADIPLLVIVNIDKYLPRYNVLA